MTNIVYTQPIARSPEEIWLFLANLCNDSRWRQEIVDVQVVSGVPGEAPATYRETVRWEGVQAEVVLTVTKSVPGSQLVVETDGVNYHSRSSWRFEPQAEHTLVTLVFSLEAEGPLNLFGPLMEKIVASWLQRDLPMLEGHLSAVL